MKNLTLNDNTQKKILKELEITEKLLSKVATDLSKTEKKATIYAMPDLGISSNVIRMCGGYFTGICAKWDSTVPFIPIDGTVNVCGTAVYKLKREITTAELKEKLEYIFKNNKKYQWNYDSGNHFVILGKSENNPNLDDGQYLIVHASAKEYKKDNLKEGLYPVKGNWFYNEIITEYDKDTNRYLRYIKGDIAEKFYNIVEKVKVFNKQKNKYFCEQILGGNLDYEFLNISHYGMPTINSLCIGCQWENQTYTLLTAPGKDIYIIEPIKNEKNCVNINNTELILTPHGLGVELNDDNIEINYYEDGLILGNKKIDKNDSINIDVDVKIRGYNTSLIEEYVNKVLNICGGTKKGKLKQLCSLTKRGFVEY